MQLRYDSETSCPCEREFDRLQLPNWKYFFCQCPHLPWRCCLDMEVKHHVHVNVNLMDYSFQTGNILPWMSTWPKPVYDLTLVCTRQGIIGCPTCRVWHNYTSSVQTAGQEPQTAEDELTDQNGAENESKKVVSVQHSCPSPASPGQLNFWLFLLYQAPCPPPPHKI